MPVSHKKKSVKKTARKVVKKQPVIEVVLSDQKPLMSTVVEAESSPPSMPAMSVVPEEEPLPVKATNENTTTNEIETESPPPPTHIDQVETPESVVTVASDDEQIEPIIVEQVDKKSKFLLFFGFGFVLGIAAASIALFFYSQHRSFTRAPVPSATSILAPSASPEPILNKKDWIWQVQNGSSLAGAGARIAASLRADGYVVESVGNADTTNYEGTHIYTKSNDEALTKLLMEEMKQTFTDATYSGTFTSTQDATATARLIIGK